MSRAYTIFIQASSSKNFRLRADDQLVDRYRLTTAEDVKISIFARFVRPSIVLV